jgi:hypothetical protein
MSIRTLATKIFKYGIIDTLEDRKIPRGAASASLNWQTFGDHVELRRGFAFLGDSSLVVGSGRVSGLKRASNALQVEVLFYTYGTKLKYFDEATQEWIENGSDRLGAAADNEDISLEEYVTNHGNQVWVNSPNIANFFKVMTANPESASPQYSGSKNYKGHIKIDTNSTFLWGRKEDKTGIYRSYIDSLNSTTVTAEAIGSSGSLTYTGTLAFISGNPQRTCFAVTFTDGTENFTDNYAGTLTGSAGGTGTINYATGAYSITFAALAAGSVTATYQWEDAQNGGIADFTGSAAGTGVIFRQDEGGGPVQNVSSYNNVYYCLHTKKTWALTLAIDDTPTGTSNVPYRENVGIPNLRASVETGDGIYYVDKVTGDDPAVRLLTYDRSGSQQVIPIEMTKNLDLNAYEFDQAAGFEYGDLILFACRRSSSAKNDRVLVYNRIWKSWDILDYAVSCFEIYNGALMGGDSLSSNVMTLFSGLTDDDAEIANFWEGKLDDFDLEGLKRTKKLRLRGAIGIDQKLKVSLSLDGAPFVEVGGSDSGGVHTYAIEGTGSYVNRSQRVTVGSQTLGRGEIGGGGDGIEAYEYERLFSVGLGKFDSVKIRLEAVAIGYVSSSLQEPWDIRYKGKKVPRAYRG